MRCRYLGTVPILALVLALPAAAAPPKNQGKPKNVLDADQLASGQFTGALLSAPGSDRTFTVRVQYQQIQLKPNALRNANNQTAHANRQLQQIARLEQQMARSRNPAQQLAQIQRILAQVQLGQLRAQQNLYTVVNRTQDIEFQAEENVKVRTMELPEQFDEKGNIKKYTREELKQLKGKDTHLPGYESAFEGLRAGQLVQVTLAAHKTKKPTTSPGDAKDKPTPDKAAPDKDTEKHKQVRLIVILKEDARAVPGARLGKRGK